MSRDLLSCDWGTTSFRLRLVSGVERKIVREIQEAAGVRFLHDEARRRGVSSPVEHRTVFEEFLRHKLEALFANVPKPSSPLPLIISGMASSSIGWHELPYARAPFALDGRGLLTEELRWNKPDWIGSTRLVSGVSTEHDMMRGEECEIIGLMSEPAMAEFRDRSLLILPGTHSKHVWIDKGSVADFRTYMTGELFDVLSNQSILRASVDLSAPEGKSYKELGQSTFVDGVLSAKERGLAGGLFQVRTRAVLGRRPLHDNTWFLSGLLIGAEVADISCVVKDRPVVLAAARELSEPYAVALKTLHPAARWVQLAPEAVENAIISAHAMIAAR
jgi:2-dehydro-3-deoxygalactonokinase